MGGIKAGKWIYSEEDLRSQIAAARRRGAAARRCDPRATRVSYDADKDRIVIEFDSGVMLGLPSALIERVSDASPEERADVTISVLGNALRWDRLDLDLGIAELAAGIFGAATWMAELGRRGGRATSIEKAVASRANGRKGGRPRKQSSTAASAPSKRRQKSTSPPRKSKSIDKK